MNKKYTIRDIAKQAGVSVATVSYVINHRDDQRISEETKKKVWQIVNLLDYRPNSSAKSLATNKTYCVALYFAKETSLLKRSEQLLVAETLVSVFKQHGYHLLLLENEESAPVDFADAVLCYDVSTESFHALGDQNLIPLIAIDSIISTGLEIFYQICTDYTRIKEEAAKHFGKESFTYLCLTPNNREVRELILNTFEKVVFVEDQIPALTGNIACSQAVLHSQLPDHACYIACDPQPKTEQVFSCMELALNRIPDCEHILYI